MHPICGLAKWLVKKRVLDFDPTETVSIPSRDGSGTRPVSTDANVIRLIEQAELNPRPKDRALDVAILYVLVNSACRVDEVCKLELTDLDLEAGCFRSLAKGRKRKSKLTYYFSPQTGAAIEEWLKFRPVRCQHGQLFCHGPKRVIADDYIRVMIRRYAAKAGLEGDRGLMPHGLKHLAGCRLLLQGIDIVTVAARLGHTKPTTTLNHYLHVDQVAVRESRFVGLATCKQDDGNHEVNNIPTAATMVVSPTMDCKLSEPIRVPKQVCRAVEKKRVPKNVAIGNARRHRPAAATEGGHPS
jgi:integrase